ncbi:MAG: YncE family protein [Ignavibacteriae bacterium]|nr:YncE family protein [Ignavibacteriota bacterium]
MGFGPDDYDSIETIIYSQHVQLLLNRRCATSGCHNTETAAEDLVMTSWQSLMQGSHNGAVVIPFRPEKSHLIFHVNRDSNIAPVANPQMPPDEPLPTVEVQFLMRWIREGAKNDFEQVPFDEPGRGRVVLTNQSDDEVAIIDATSNLLMRMVPVGVAPQPESPHNVTVDRQGNFYYVNLIAGNEIWKFDARTNEHVGTLSLGAQRSPAQIALSPDGTVGYVTNYDLTKTNRSVQKFSALSMQLESEIFDQRMIAPHGITRRPTTDTESGSEYWIACEQSDNIAILLNDDVVVIKADSTVPDLPTSDYTPNFGPYQTVFTPDGAFAYITCRLSDEVRVFNAQTLQLVNIIPVGENPLIPDITPDGRLVYVANRNSNSVSVINTLLNGGKGMKITDIQNVGVEPHGVLAAPLGDFIYVSCENVNSPDAPHHPVSGLKTPGFVTVIDAANHEIVLRIEVGAFAAGIAFLPEN